MTRRPAAVKYYVVIGRHPKPKPKSRSKRSELHVVGKPIKEEEFVFSDPELSARIKYEYISILGLDLFENRRGARWWASYLEKKGYIDVEVCAVVPLKKFVREPRLMADEPEK